MLISLIIIVVLALSLLLILRVKKMRNQKRLGAVRRKSLNSVTSSEIVSVSKTPQSSEAEIVAKETAEKELEEAPIESLIEAEIETLAPEDDSLLEEELEEQEKEEPKPEFVQHDLFQPATQLAEKAMQAIPEERFINSIEETGVIQLLILSPSEISFKGYDLLPILLSAGLRFGEMQIFHRHKEIRGAGPVLFSLASATKPGNFNLTTMGEASHKALVVFMELSGEPVDDLKRFNLMLKTGQQLADALSGMLHVSKDQSIDEALIKAIREKINTNNST